MTSYLQMPNLYRRYLLNTYRRLPIEVVKARGLSIWDIDNREYLDFFSGWGVANIGYNHPLFIKALQRQIKQAIHIPNNLYNPLQLRLAQEINRIAFKGGLFFCNSGAEANEAAIKFSRLYGQGRRYEIITMQGSFHGRTLCTLSATGQEKYQRGFSPLVRGFKIVKFSDIEALKKAYSKKTIAIILELIQGEGGVNVADQGYIQHLRAFCDANDLLLIIDEVQTGIGRTGRMFAYQHYHLQPDIITMAKAIGGGLSMGAILVRARLKPVFQPGHHGSTFGGNPLACAGALAVLEIIKRERLIENSRKMGRYLMQGLSQLKKDIPCIRDIRGRGLMLGIELNREGGSIVEECLKKRLLINCTQGNILRLMPALTVQKFQIDRALDILSEVMRCKT